MRVGKGRCAAHDVPAVALRTLCLAAAACVLVLAAESQVRANPKASFETGYDAYQRGDFSQALAVWKPLAEAGDLRAQYNLGLIHAEGRGVPRDRAQAAAWWRRAAEGGHVRAMHNLALAHIAGVPDAETGAPAPDYDSALHWLNRAAEEGSAQSVYFLGTMYRHGLGVERDEAKAASLIMESAEQGYVHAQYNLAEVYLDGEGVKPDTEESLRWLKAAAESGSPRAQYRMAARFAEGEGARPDLIEALKWCLLAARHGHAGARDSLDDLVLRASLKDLEEATRRAREVELAGGGTSVR